ncbi:hypothetical protein [Rhizobium sp. BG4]|uniref:hypothetical protein n=1 Tax=Rhizobium sp. BG4 TaxID=2613770 RepID=UPI00193D8651|nr:hypothetical protein [Rhizobium sp. BG4]QRM44601.1 hypothetical protein F2982_14810 [Rhizobium sp. BG4]
MDPANNSRMQETPRLGSVAIYRRIAEAALRMADNGREIASYDTQELFCKAVGDYVGSTRRRAISDCYRQLQLHVSSTCGDLTHLPSERTFRRRIASVDAEAIPAQPHDGR